MRICTRDGCNNEAIFDTNICDNCLNKRDISNKVITSRLIFEILRNFGMSIICTSCHLFIDYGEDYEKHICKK